MAVMVGGRCCDEDPGMAAPPTETRDSVSPLTVVRDRLSSLGEEMVALARDQRLTGSQRASLILASELVSRVREAQTGAAELR
jgi:hypothetical protein